MFDIGMIKLMLLGIVETLYMTLGSTLLAYVIGLPVGVLLYLTAPGGIKENSKVYLPISIVVNALRSAPFIILLVALIPVTRVVTGSAIGSPAMIFPLVVGASPFIARLVESSLNEVDHGVIEAATSMGASIMQTVLKVLIVEATPSLINGAAIAVTTILGYTAMAGFCGGGGLGAIAINYGYYRYNTLVMLVTLLLIIIIVQILQVTGNRIALKCDKRRR